MENKDEILSKLRTELAQAADECLRAARSISKKRYEAARKLEKLVEAEINDLAMKSAFHIEVSGTDEEANWTASGFDQIFYMISTNPGEPLRRLEHIASGGELSRVMLALKASVEAGTPRSQVVARALAHRTLILTRSIPHWGPGRRGRRQEAESLVASQSSALRHSPAANRHLRRSSLFD